MSDGYSGTPLGKKLGIREGHRLASLFAPPGFADLLELPPHTILETDPLYPVEPLRGTERAFDVVLVFIPDRTVLGSRLDLGRRLMAWHGALWTCWPKQGSPLATEMREGDIRAAGLESGLVDVKICAIDADWSGLKFVHRTEDRPVGRAGDGGSATPP